jgi:hypothetical protein
MPKRKRSKLKRVRAAILAEAGRLQKAGIDVTGKRIVIGGRRDESVGRAMRKEAANGKEKEAGD